MSARRALGRLGCQLLRELVVAAAIAAGTNLGDRLVPPKDPPKKDDDPS